MPSVSAIRSAKLRVLQNPTNRSASAVKSGILRIATGVPRPVDVPTYADAFACGRAASIVGGPEISELDAAMIASSTTPPAENPVR